MAFHCRMRFNWMVFAVPGYQYKPLDSKRLTKKGAEKFETFFDGFDDARRAAILETGPLKSIQVPIGGGMTEECVALADVETEVNHRLALMKPEWTFRAVAFPAGMEQPYKYRINPPECVHHYLLQSPDAGGTFQNVTFSALGTTIVAQMLATLEFFEHA